MTRTEKPGSTPSQEGRLLYEDSHWAREEDAQKALDQYLRLGSSAYSKTTTRLFLALAGEVKGKTVLDYGGGAGITAIPLAKAGAHVVLVDAEASALRAASLYARKEGVGDRLQTIQSGSFPVALKDQRFDIVIAKDIVEHIDDDEQALRDLAACQGEGGVLLLSTQNRLSLNYVVEGGYQKYWRGNRGWCGWDRTHLRFYTPASLRRKLRQAGYEPNRWASVYLVPYDLLSWLSLLRVTIQLPWLRHLDLTLGRVFPFNRLGWNILVRASRG